MHNSGTTLQSPNLQTFKELRNRFRPPDRELIPGLLSRFTNSDSGLQSDVTQRRRPSPFNPELNLKKRRKKLLKVKNRNPDSD
jgi:hypothetical protein